LQRNTTSAENIVPLITTK